ATDFYIDLWGTGLMAEIQQAGLTNKHALYVDSHSLASFGYNVYRPSDRCSKRHFWYRMRDFAVTLGPATNSLHNIYLSGCNTDNQFSLQEVKQYFPCATNIVHVMNRH